MRTVNVIDWLEYMLTCVGRNVDSGGRKCRALWLRMHFSYNQLMFWPSGLQDRPSGLLMISDADKGPRAEMPSPMRKLRVEPECAARFFPQTYFQ